VLTLQSISGIQKHYSIVKKTRIRGNNSRSFYRLDLSLNIKLSNGLGITIPKGFEWDLSTAPRFLWSVLPPDGDFELAYLIHDYLWIEKEKMYLYFRSFNLEYNQKFTDKEMLKWSKATNGTKKFSTRNIDNYIRYYSVRMLGWFVWNGYINLNR
jgi:hypothetical protein